jgi:spore coat protein U-like protein
VVNYDIFSDSAHTVPWGNINGFDTVDSTGNGQNQVLVVYGQVLSQPVFLDTYSDTITVTLTY